MIQSYAELGWSMIPVEPRGKRPVGGWVHAQTARAPVEQVEAWSEEELNLGVVTGKLSGVVVVDCDTEAGVHAVAKLGMPVTPTATTGRGRHYFLRYQEGVRNSAGRVAPGVDVRGEGGFVVVPPSVHPSGREYRWVGGLSPDDVPPAECPAWLLEGSQVPQNGRSQGEWAKAFRVPVVTGERNQRCAELAGYLLRKWVEPEVAVLLMQLWNRDRCNPSMSESEVSRTVMSIAKREETRRAR